MATRVLTHSNTLTEIRASTLSNLKVRYTSYSYLVWWQIGLIVFTSKLVYTQVNGLLVRRGYEITLENWAHTGEGTTNHRFFFFVSWENQHVIAKSEKNSIFVLKFQSFEVLCFAETLQTYSKSKA